MLLGFYAPGWKDVAKTVNETSLTVMQIYQKKGGSNASPQLRLRSTALNNFRIVQHLKHFQLPTFLSFPVIVVFFVLIVMTLSRGLRDNQRGRGCFIHDFLIDL